MSTIFPYKLVADWQDIRSDSIKGLINGLRPEHRLLLSSDGSLTLDIERLIEAEIKIELISMAGGLLEPDAAAYLQAAPGAQVCERVVWLKTRKRRLVYAHTIFLLNKTDSAIIASLDASPDEPLGKVLNRKQIIFTKSRMQAGVVNCEQAASALDIKRNTLFIARRYVLADTGVSASMDNRIKAAVTEVFSPELISSAAVKS